jgi:microcystin-dependent protein
MAQKKITDLTLRADFDGTVNLPGDDTAQTWRVTGAQIKTWLQTEFANLFVPAGTIVATGRATAAGGYLLCDGTAVSRSTYSDLFTAIGTTFGVGDGSTTFNLPNTAGMVLRGTGTGTIEARSKVGPALGAFQEDQLQGHWHRHEDGSANAFGGSTFQSGAGSTINGVAVGGGSFSARVGNPLTDGTNGTPRTGLDTRVSAIGVNYMIKT